MFTAGRMVVILAQSVLVRMFSPNPQTACASGTDCLRVILFSLRRLIADMLLRCPEHKQENKSRSDLVTLHSLGIGSYPLRLFSNKKCVYLCYLKLFSLNISHKDLGFRAQRAFSLDALFKMLCKC